VRIGILLLVMMMGNVMMSRMMMGVMLVVRVLGIVGSGYSTVVGVVGMMMVVGVADKVTGGGNSSGSRLAYCRTTTIGGRRVCPVVISIRR
jgi:hypothetical protein